MFKRNWREIVPRLDFKETCYVRDFFRRKDMLSLEGGYKVTQYIEWVRRTTIPPNKKLPYHRQNLEQVLYILQGEGVIQIGNTKNDIITGDSVYIPNEIPHTIYSIIDEQPLVYMDYAVRTPPESDEIRIEYPKVKEEKSDLKVKRWSDSKCESGHNDTCWTYPIFGREEMKYILFATMMSVPKVLGYHRHNTEAIYYVESGFGSIKVGGEDVDIRDGDSIYIPNGVAHRCESKLEDQPLNVFCFGVAIPYSAQVWVEEDLPSVSV